MILYGLDCQNTTIYFLPKFRSLRSYSAITYAVELYCFHLIHISQGLHLTLHTHLLRFAFYTFYTSVDVTATHQSVFPVYIPYTSVTIIRLLRIRSYSFWAILILVRMGSECFLVSNETSNLGLLDHDGEGTTFLPNTGKSSPVGTA
jgi:hypothetical protein